MKIEEYPCVKIKRMAQNRIYFETRHLAFQERLARHQRSFEELLKRKEAIVLKLSETKDSNT